MNSFFTNNSSSSSMPMYTGSIPDTEKNMSLSKNIWDNLNILHKLFKNCSDIVYREFSIDALNRSAVLIFINGLVDTKVINETIITSIMNMKQVTVNDSNTDNITEIAKQHSLQIADIDEVLTIGEIEDALLNGNTIFLLDGDDKALNMATTGWKERNIAQPVIEKVIRGPMEGFTENIYTNTALIRRKIKSSKLKFEEYVVGRQTRTKVDVGYLEGVVDEKIVEEVKKRIEKLDVDSILEGGYLEELIEDTSFTVFPQIQHTERPDKVAGNILEGRVAILVDGTPFVLIAPAVFIQFFQSCDDYYERYPVATAVRIIRFIFFGISLFLPGFYVATILYDKELIPTPLLISILEAAHKVPFPIFVEALIMEITFEALREAGLRIPIPAGQTIGIVGALVIGEAAVRAGIVSPIMVIVISITAVASFGIPSYDMGYTIRILRFVILLLGALLGLYGIMLVILVLLIHMVSLKSFGVDYLSPIAPLNLGDYKDNFSRHPWWAMRKRPASVGRNNPNRQKASLKPNVPDDNSK